MTRYSTQQLNGFTLIEMLVALSLFTIVITIAAGAFLALISVSKGVQSEQTVMTTLTFVLDSMTREIRTGSNYWCNTRAALQTPAATTAYRDCINGDAGLSLIESGSSITSAAGNKRIAYYFDTTSSTAKTIMRKVGTNAPQSIVSSGITLTSVEFFVTGTERFDINQTNITQPSVTIVLQALDDAGVTTTLQTTVTQRELDI